MSLELILEILVFCLKNKFTEEPPRQPQSYHAVLVTLEVNFSILTLVWTFLESDRTSLSDAQGIFHRQA